MDQLQKGLPEDYSWAKGKVVSLVRSQDKDEMSISLPPKSEKGIEMSSVSQSELDAKLDALRAETKIGGAELRADFEKFRADFAEMRGDMSSGLEAIRGDMHKANTDTLKWVVGTMLASGSVIVAVMTFLLNNAAPKAQGSTAQQPIVIQIPNTSGTGSPQPLSATPVPAHLNDKKQ